MFTNKQWTWVVYFLQAAGLFVGLTSILGVIFNYAKRDDVQDDPVLASHFSWQIRTFWWSLLWYVVGFIASFVLVGIIIIFATWCWELYRVARGMICLSEDRPLKKPVLATD
jgi:uncharacterized membrane protein